MKILPGDNRSSETTIYMGIWVVLIIFYLLNLSVSRYNAGLPWIDPKDLGYILLTFIPPFVLFLINNYLLIPRLLLRNRYGKYIGLCLLVLVVVWGMQSVHTYNTIIEHRPHLRMPGKTPPHLLPMPVLIDLLYDLLTIGANLVIALIFQHLKEKFEKESLMKANVESQLASLRAQINPHFYMNMLNNIHGMIEIDPAQAQDMVIELSQLMRYMLYESSHDFIALSEEIKMIDIYVNLMRRRYPADKVEITTSMPSEKDATGAMIAPLLFIVFIENSFKHGISYRHRSYVDVSIRVEGEHVLFSCRNSIAAGQPDHSGHHDGIGLRNVERRMSLIYGEKACLDISSDSSIYSVTLTIPTHEA